MLLVFRRHFFFFQKPFRNSQIPDVFHYVNMMALNIKNNIYSTYIAWFAGLLNYGEECICSLSFY